MNMSVGGGVPAVSARPRRSALPSRHPSILLRRTSRETSAYVTATMTVLSGSRAPSVHLLGRASTSTPPPRAVTTAAAEPASSVCPGSRSRTWCSAPRRQRGASTKARRWCDGARRARPTQLSAGLAPCAVEQPSGLSSSPAGRRGGPSRTSGRSAQFGQLGHAGEGSNVPRPRSKLRPAGTLRSHGSAAGSAAAAPSAAAVVTQLMTLSTSGTLRASFPQSTGSMAAPAAPP
jgi:hypothetical protein